MHVTFWPATLIEQVPFAPMRFDGIDADAKQKMARAAEQQTHSFPLNCLPPPNRVVLRIKEADVSSLLQQKQPCKHERQRAKANHKQGAPAQPKQSNQGRGNQKREP